MIIMNDAIGVYFRAGEKELLSVRAKANHMSLSNYCRKAALTNQNNDLFRMDFFKNLQMQLNHLYTNLVQLRRNALLYDHDTSNIDAAITEIQLLREKIENISDYLWPTLKSGK